MRQLGEFFVDRHPNADNLLIAKVDRGDGFSTIVTGAPNLSVGVKVPLVMSGGKLPGGVEIGSRKFRGIMSEGMLCAGDELGLSDDHSGIYILEADAPLGQDLRRLLGDVVLDLYITPNRADCMSVIGVAREVQAISDEISKAGGTPLAVAKDGRLLGVVQLKDIVKGGIRERFAELRRMGIRTVMITGDNPMTAAAIAAEAGVDDFLAQATPEDKLKLIRDEQAKGKLVAMCGDGTNDAPALAQADVGVAMNTGTQAAREAGNMVDLDSNPTKLIEVVEIGKQLLMTRGALTTFSIANDVAKYFAIIPAMFLAFYPQLGVLNVMHLASPQSAILSAIIFNALIIIALIPLALKGVAYRAIGAGALLRRNLMIYGVGGIIIPFIGIKAIDVVVAALHLV